VRCGDVAPILSSIHRQPFLPIGIEIPPSFICRSCAAGHQRPPHSARRLGVVHDPRIASTPADEHKTANEHDASTVEATASRE
jgi:hypothetical protein